MMLPRIWHAKRGVGTKRLEEDAGIGVVISQANHAHLHGLYHMIVHMDVAGSCAQSGMLQLGDVIESVNGMDMRGRSLGEYTSALKGPLGSLVEIGIIRCSAKTTIDAASPETNSFSGGSMYSLATSQQERAGVWGVGGVEGGGEFHGVGKSQNDGNAGNDVSYNGCEEVQRVVLSTEDPEKIARRIRIARVYNLGGYNIVDGLVIFVVHSIVATCIVLFLVQTGMLDLEWDLTPWFQEDRVATNEVVAGGFFYSFAPWAIVTGECVRFDVNVGRSV